MELNKIYNGKCEDVLKTFPDNFFDGVVTDPPYGINFMNKHWDYDVPSVDVWEEILRVLKPGAHILVACGTRTQHRMTVNIEDAGFEIRDVISWIYGSGFPKSMDISKAIDKMYGAERKIVGVKPGHEQFANRGNLSSVQSFKGTMGGEGGFSRPWMDDPEKVERYHMATEATTDQAKQWDGWGTALKPATEFWTLARKPIEENTIAENVLKYGTGGLNIDGSRVQRGENDRTDYGRDKLLDYPRKSVAMGDFNQNTPYVPDSNGRFPANVILDEFMGSELDKQSGISVSSGGSGEKSKGNLGGHWQRGSAEHSGDNAGGLGDVGGASRFFYCPKPDNFERDKGLKNFEKKKMDESRKDGNVGGDNPRNRGVNARRNIHPTVKPIDLMRYLVKLIIPKGGVVLDPYTGSGTTLIGAKLELINYVGIEMSDEYCEIANARVAAWNPEKYIEQKLF